MTPNHPAYLVYSISVFVVVFVYFAWSWRRIGRTVGMTVWKIRLAGDGRPVSWRTAVSRFAFAAVSTACLGAGFLWSLVPPRRLAWHDRWSDSFLVDAPPTTQSTTQSATKAQTPHSD